MISNPHIHRCMIPVTIASIVGVTVGAQWPGNLPAAMVCACATAMGMIWILWRKGATFLWPMIFFALLGYLSIQPWLGVRMPEQHISHFADQGVWTITGIISDAPRLKGKRTQFVLAATELVNKKQHHTVNGKMRVSARDFPANLQRGDKVTLKGRLRSIRSFANPGGFDYARFMALRGIRVQAYARKGSFRVIETASVMPWQAVLDALRQTLADRIDTALDGRDTESSILLKALIMGQRDQITSELRQAFSAAGVSHVLAISGLHIGMVAAAAFGLSRWLLSWVPIMLTLGWTRRGAALISLIAVLFYALIAGMSPSTQRASIMVTMVLVGYWVGRRHDWLNALAIAAMLILIVYPPALLSVSFQLSFAAVLAIVLGHKAIPFMLETSQEVWWRRWTHRWVAFMWVSGLAILGTLPLVLYYFNQTSLVGLATNLVVVPIVGFVVVPAGLFGSLALAVSPQLASIFWHIAIIGLRAILWLVHGVDQWPWAMVRTVTPSMWEILLYYTCLGGVLGWRKLPKRGWVAIGLCVLWAVDVGYWSYQRFGCRDLRVTAIDVGQGTANLLQLPGGYTVLIDGGGFSDNSVFDVGQRIVAPLLWRLKIKTVDLVILSHPNSDHLNGLLFILRHFNVAEVWSNHQPVSTWGYRKWQSLIKKGEINHVVFESQPSSQIRNETIFTVLGPPPDYRQRQALEPWRDVNNNSLVVRVQFGQVSILFGGDIGASTEADLIYRHGRNGLSSTILMVPHHGSRHSGTASFLEAVHPKEAIISCGWNNRYGFPHSQAEERLEAVGTRVWRTSLSGAVQIMTDGRSYRVKPHRSTAENHTEIVCDGKRGDRQVTGRQRLQP